MNLVCFPGVCPRSIDRLDAGRLERLLAAALNKKDICATFHRGGQ